MTWQVTQLQHGLGDWRGEWDALNQRLYAGHPFRDSRFVDAMLRHFGDGSVRLCIHRTDGRVDGMLLLCPRRFGIWTQFVPDQAQAAPPLLERSDMLRELFPALSPFAWAIELMCQDPHFAPAGLIHEGATTRLKQHVLTMNVELDGGFGEYWEGRSRKLVQNLRRYQRRIEQECGAPELRVTRDAAEMAAAVARYAQLESMGWKGQEGTAVNVDDAQGRFYTEIMERFAETGQAEVIEYWLGEKLIASRMVATGAGMAIMLKTAYDETLSKYAPGRLLLKDLLQRMFEQGNEHVVEFYTHATQDQLAWATGRRHIVHAMLFHRPCQGRLYDIIQTIKSLAGATKQSNPGRAEADGTMEMARFDGVDGLPPECRLLFAAGERDSFDLSEDWFRLMESKGPVRQSNVVHYVFKRDGTVQGVFPLLLSEAGKGLRQASGLTSFYSSLYRPLLSSAADVSDVAACISRIVRDTRADALRFDAMDPAHPSYGLLEEAARKAGLKPSRFFCFGNWYLPVAGRSFDEYFKGLASQVRNTVQRREKKFLAQGRGRLEMVTGGEELEKAIQAWGKIYAASWKSAEPFPEFMPGLIRACAARGWLRLGLAYYDGEAVAAQLWIVCNGRAAIYKLAYDEKYFKYSPGSVLTVYLMRHALDVDKVNEIDYLIGDDAYKKDWMSHRRERWGIVAYNPRTLRGMAGALVQAMGAVRKKLFKRQPAQSTQGKVDATCVGGSRAAELGE